MMRTRFGLAAGLAAVGVAVLVGCRGTPKPGETPPDPAVSLGDGQVADVQVALGRTLENQGEVKQAAHLYTEAVKNDPKRAEGHVRLAVLADKQGKFEDSAGHYRKALALEPDNPNTLCNLGYSLYLQGRWAEAEQALRKAVALKPDHARAHNNLGLVLARAGRPDEALAAFRLAGCGDADAYANLAYGATMNESFAEARRYYQRALAVDPGSAPARAGLAGLDKMAAKRGQVEPAPIGRAAAPGQ